MTKRRTAIAAASALVLAAGSAGAIAATSKDDAREREDAVLSDAAKRLDVTPQRLRDALGAAQDAQLDRAVKNGRLTQAQADELKERRRADGRVLGFGLRGRHGGRGPGGPGMRLGGDGDVLAAVAKALGVSRDELHEQLHDGRSIADVAKAHGKDLDDVKAAAKAAVTKELARAVEDGRLTDAQRDRMVEHLDEHLDRLASGRFPGGRGRGFGPGHGPPPGP